EERGAHVVVQVLRWQFFLWILGEPGADLSSKLIARIGGNRVCEHQESPVSGLRNGIPRRRIDSAAGTSCGTSGAACTPQFVVSHLSSRIAFHRKNWLISRYKKEKDQSRETDGTGLTSTPSHFRSDQRHRKRCRPADANSPDKGPNGESQSSPMSNLGT